MRAILVLTAAFAGLAVPAHAESTEAGCGNAPKSEWMAESDLRARAAGMGYDLRKVKVEDGCYEVYAIGKDGARAELYLNPVTAAVVKIKESH